MLPAQRNRLIERGLAFTHAADPASLLFQGHPAFAASRRTAAETAVFEEGLEGSEPQVFEVLKTALPPGLVIKPKTSKFQCDGRIWRVVSLSNQPGEPYLRILANIPTANGR